MILLAAFLSFLLQASPATAAPLPSRQDCLLLVEVTSGKILKKIGGDFCQERIAPFSSFKVALAAMAFDAGVLKEQETLKWDGTRQFIPNWEKDHDARGWLRDSVVWFSQRLTERLGMNKIRRFLKDFRYGNQDFSGGLTEAWLGNSLKISPIEQVDFLKRLWKRELKLSPAALETVLRLLPEETGAKGWKVRGKTGTGSTWKDPARKGGDAFRLGWYVGYAEKAGLAYAFAVDLKEKAKDDKFVWSGKEAKERLLRELESLSDEVNR